MEYVGISGPLTLSAKRDANNAKFCMSSRLIRTTFQFLCVLLSVFRQFAYINCLSVNLEYVYINGPLAQSAELGANNANS